MTNTVLEHIHVHLYLLHNKNIKHDMIYVIMLFYNIGAKCPLGGWNMSRMIDNSSIYNSKYVNVHQLWWKNYVDIIIV
jgi:hypothetical protein